MSFKKRVETLSRLDALIRRRATGNYHDLAQRLKISPATLYRYLDDLRSMGASIDYCRTRKVFSYQGDFNFRAHLLEM